MSKKVTKKDKKSLIKSAQSAERNLDVCAANAERWYVKYLSAYSYVDQTVIDYIHGDADKFVTLFAALEKRIEYKKMKEIDKNHFRHFKSYVKIERCGIAPRPKKKSKKEKQKAAGKAQEERIAEKLEVEVNAPLPENATIHEKEQKVKQAVTGSGISQEEFFDILGGIIADK